MRMSRLPAGLQVAVIVAVGLVVSVVVRRVVGNDWAWLGTWLLIIVLSIVIPRFLRRRRPPGQGRSQVGGSAEHKR